LALELAFARPCRDSTWSGNKHQHPTPLIYIIFISKR
jgi:hypothetical protein